MNKAGSLMKTDIKETADSYVLDIDMPGIDKKDIGIELRDGYLTVSAKKEESSEEKGEHHYLRRERSYGACSRSFYVGEDRGQGRGRQAGKRHSDHNRAQEGQTRRQRREENRHQIICFAHDM